VIRRLGHSLLLALASASAGAAEPALRTVDPAYLATIVDDEPALPRGWARGERERWSQPVLRLPLAPPIGPVATPAETARNSGLLIRWGSLNSVLTEMAVAITTGEPDVTLHVVVSGSSQQSSAASTLAGAGADLSRVDFIVAPSNSVWMRDYGPRFIDDGGRRAGVDHVYNRPRPLDDAIPQPVLARFGEALYDMPIVHGGGNFHLFEDGTAYMTTLVVAENPGLSATQIQGLYASYQGLDLTLVDPLPASFDSTQHIDMWMLPADGNRVLVNRYPATGGIYATPYAVTESAAALLAQRGKQVLRLDGFSANGTHYTYANAVVLDRLVLGCRFNGYEAQNQAARAVFEQAFPTRQFVPIDCSSIITLSGALHCIVMHVPAVLLRNGFE
jgi:agmatine/peptidylarginine deiminase